MYWPNPGTPGLQIKSMYDRLTNKGDADSKVEAKSKPEEFPQENGRIYGQTNGQTIGAKSESITVEKQAMKHEA